MSEVEDGIDEHLRREELRARHRDSGLWDDTLLERYTTRQDLVAFVDETHRATEDGQVGYYGLSAVVFHADDLPEIRRDLEEIAGGTFWHSKEAVKDQRLRGRIGDMNEYIAAKTAMPVVVFDVRDHEITEAQERAVRDVCLRGALRTLDEQGITDVVLDNFPQAQQRNVRLDQAIVHELRERGEVSEQMWMHHGRMSEEHALWSADTVAWSVQRHHFGTKARDSQHVAPLSGHLQEVHALTGKKRELRTAMRADLVGREGQRERRAPIHSLAQRVQQLRAQGSSPVSRPAAAPRLDAPKAPPVQGPEGPSRSL